MGACTSAVVRVKDERESLVMSLRSLRAQTVDVEVVVVDSGSVDGSLELARAEADRVVELAPGTFTFGRALNAGAHVATGDVVLALSSHCALPRPDWLARALEHFGDPVVAAVHGARTGPDRRPLPGTLRQTAAHALAHPYWGLSNHASVWRRAVWAQVPFDEELTACEDKAWAHAVLARGLVVVVDPELEVDKPHRRTGGLRALYRRSRREASALGGIAPLPERGVAHVARDWWTAVPPGPPLHRAVRRANPYRVAEIAGRYSGERGGRHR